VYAGPKTIETSQQIYNVKSISPAKQEFHHFRIHSTSPMAKMGVNPKKLPKGEALGTQPLPI
jgi:hypothetical protein